MLILFLLQHERHFTVVTMLIHLMRGWLVLCSLTSSAISRQPLGGHFLSSFAKEQESVDRTRIDNTARTSSSPKKSRSQSFYVAQHTTKTPLVELVRRESLSISFMESSSTWTTRAPSSSSTVEETISKETVTAATTTATTFAKGEASRFASGKLLIALQIFAIPSGPNVDHSAARTRSPPEPPEPTSVGEREESFARSCSAERVAPKCHEETKRKRDRGSLRSGGLLINRARNTPRSPPPPWKNWRRWEYGAVLRRFGVFKGG